MEKPLTLLYTQNIRGDLALLPRLHTFIRQIRRDIPDGDQVMLCDLGAACVPEVWPCGITEGRATFFVMDAMGYHAANIIDVLGEESREKLDELVMVELIDDEHSSEIDRVAFITDAANLPESHYEVVTLLVPAEKTHFAGDMLHLAPVETGQVGIARIKDDQLETAAIRTMPDNTPPEPTIAGAVDFVESEARFFEKRGRSADDSSD